MQEQLAAVQQDDQEKGSLISELEGALDSAKASVARAQEEHAASLQEVRCPMKA